MDVLLGGGLALAGTLIPSLLQSIDRKRDRADKLREEQERKAADRRNARLVSLRTVALVLHRVSRELGLAATVSALDARESRDQFEVRYRELTNRFDDAHVQLIGHSPAVVAQLNNVSVAMSRCWGQIGNAIRLNILDAGEGDRYQRAFDAAFEACGNISSAVGESLAVVDKEISDLME